jgi:hypothetical protein
VTYTSLANLVARFSNDPDVTSGLNDKLAAAARAKTTVARNRHSTPSRLRFAGRPARRSRRRRRAC